MNSPSSAPETLHDRRRILGTLGVAGLALQASAGLASAQDVRPTSGRSLIDKWTAEKKARLGVWLSAPPIQTRDPATNKPVGYVIDVVELMMKDLEVEIEYVVVPFAQQIAAWMAGKVDMIGGPITITPQRALRGMFADMPVFYEDTVVWLRPGSSVTSLDQLTTAKFSVLAGSSQQTTGEQILPKATFIPLDSMSSVVNNTSTGRSDACLLSAGQLLGQIKDHPDMKLLPGPSLWVDMNTYLIPQGDLATHAWISNWLRYQSTHNTFSRLWEKWFVSDVSRQFGVKTTAVGPLGAQVSL